MKSLRIALSVVLMLLGTTGFSTTDTPSPNAEIQKTFEKLKSLAGSWQSDNPKIGLSVKFRVTSNGTAILSEMEAAPDNMVTMFHLNDGQLMVTHYCAEGNQPRMVASISPDGKTVKFDFIDGT